MRAAFVAFVLAASVLPAGAATFRWSSQGDYLSADPHAQNEGINNLLNDEIFERLTCRDEALDRLIDAVETEMDPVKRRSMMHDAFARVRDEVYTIPLHRQVIPWAVRANVHVVHRPDNVVEALRVRVGK